ncbi:NmrA family NAD(P)-binding protein [Paractinoplanes rishiriensis]|uniref:Nucleoside-diphosphate sugar epimerase n=1 Tax=Paractinoplanes rishiriensis TaxID=1050105 RepID=A0A919K2F9_9ACTN|nr:NAD(P)H-binding protein [Actinoplanes rishiriensis]GIE95396.1 nucleoside-diphosphate sugar epimerase [Actinoplanes rishiriensis]
MYAITGVTGHVGSAAARTLRAANQPIRTVARDPSKGDVVADFADTSALTKAFDGCDGAFVLLPTVPPFTEAAHHELSASIADAVRASSLRHVVLLSSWGADLPAGTGPVRWLYHLENLLRDTGATVTAIRAPHFQEKVETVLEAATGAGVYPVFGDSADVPVPMVATRDIGEAVANALVSPPAASEIVVLEAPSYTERQVADALGEQLGRPLSVVTIPRPGWLGALTAAAVPEQLAEELVALYAADADGRLLPRGDRRVRCTTGITATLREVTG